MGGWRGRGISVAFEHFLCPLSGDFDDKFLVFVNPTKGYFSTFELFSSPKSREFDQCRTYARTPPSPPSPSKQVLETVVYCALAVGAICEIDFV